jgi:hypothetical protein
VNLYGFLVSVVPVAIFVAVPTLLVLGWLALWVFQRRVGPRFFVAAFGLALACLPAGTFIGWMEDHAASCAPGDPNTCLAPYGTTLWLTGLFSLLCCLVLLGLTPLVALVRRKWRGSAH